MTCGIYKITNKINGKCYIGQSVNIKQRWREHKSLINGIAGTEYSYYPIYQAFHKYGIENFQFDILEECEIEKLNIRERYWINYYKSNDSNKGYNQNSGGTDGQFYKKYDYELISKDYLEGMDYKNLEEKYGCSDGVITRALDYYNIDSEIRKNRRIEKKIRPIIAYEIKTKKPLKKFKSIIEARKFLKCSAGISKALVKPFISTSYGFYWDYLTDENSSFEEVSNEEFFKKQDLTKFTLKKYKE